MTGRHLIVAVLAAVLWAWPLARAHAEGGSDPLTLHEVLLAVDATHPDLEVADRLVDRADAERFAARGSWDPDVRVGTVWAPVGYYDNGQVDALVRQATPAWGLGFFAGYRLGWGTYPVYRGGLQTLSRGEVRAGLDLPLWKDGPIDARRAEIRTTRLRSGAAACERRATRLRVAQRAARAYWRWVASGLEVRIQRNLLAVAETRDAGLRDQAALGSIPPIVVVDNERLVLDRRAKLVEAQQIFQRATLELSLFLRNAGKKPQRAGEGRLPQRIPDAVSVDLGSEEDDVAHALARRPEACRLDQERAAARVALRLARNQRAPAIDARAFVARDLGSGPAELAPTELGAGLTVEMPLLLRRARGQYRAAQAEVRGLDAQLRGLRDRVAAEVRQARVDLDAARKQVVIARRQVEAARNLADAEREKLREGASDLVVVNLRELAAADAARLEVEALAAYQRARADYLTATGRGL